MNSKKSTLSLKYLIVVAILLIVTGSIIGTLNLGQINDKITELSVQSTNEELIETTDNLIDSEMIIASYTPRREVASDEVVSRYARARQAELYNSIDEITISKDMDLTVRCNVSRDDFIALIAGVKADTTGFFEENAGTIYDLCEQYQLNEIFFCGLISAESGWDIAGNHRRTHNYISLMSGNGLIQFR